MNYYGEPVGQDEDRDFHYSTDAEWDRADAAQRGEENPDAAWVCTDRDVWHANPYYKGPAMPHPESQEYIDMIANEQLDDLVAELMAQEEPVYTSEYGYEDAAPTHDEVGDIPF
jgi:hypothetical protein